MKRLIPFHFTHTHARARAQIHLHSSPVCTNGFSSWFSPGWAKLNVSVVTEELKWPLTLDLLHYPSSDNFCITSGKSTRQWRIRIFAVSPDPNWFVGFEAYAETMCLLYRYWQKNKIKLQNSSHKNHSCINTVPSCWPINNKYTCQDVTWTESMMRAWGLNHSDSSPTRLRLTAAAAYMGQHQNMHKCTDRAAAAAATSGAEKQSQKSSSAGCSRLSPNVSKTIDPFGKICNLTAEIGMFTTCYKKSLGLYS